MKNRFRGLSESRKLEMLQMSVEEIYNDVYQEGFEKGYHVGIHNERTGACEEPAPKTPNQRRAGLIQRAREFVELKTRVLKCSSQIEEGYDFKKLENPKFHGIITKADFVIDSEKKTVVALISYLRGKTILSRGIAKCHPDEVFNADIGKAIALARALEIEIPQEFLEAVQPDEKVVGMKVKWDESRNSPKGIVKEVKPGGIYSDVGLECAIDSPFGINGTILDDSNAAYPEASAC